MGNQYQSISEAEVGVTTGTPLYYFEKNAFDKIFKSNSIKFNDKNYSLKWQGLIHFI